MRQFLIEQGLDQEELSNASLTGLSYQLDDPLCRLVCGEDDDASERFKLFGSDRDEWFLLLRLSLLTLKEFYDMPGSDDHSEKLEPPRSVI
jgi:hypothetical protein